MAKTKEEVQQKTFTGEEFLALNNISNLFVLFITKKYKNEKKTIEEWTKCLTSDSILEKQ